MYSLVDFIILYEKELVYFALNDTLINQEKEYNRG